MKQFAWLFVCCLCLPAMAQEAVVRISVDTGKTFQVMQGFGSSVRSFDDGHLWNVNQGGLAPRLPQEQREEILRLVYQDLGLTRIRFVPSRGQNQRDFDRTTEYTRQALRFGAETFFVSPLQLEGDVNQYTPEAAMRHALGVIQYWKSKGLELPYYSIINEPGYTRSGIISKEYILAVIKLLGPKLREAGLKTQIVITDDWTPGEAFKRCSYILADPESRKYIGALAYHLYSESPEDIRKMAALSQTYKIPVWMTEFSDPRYAGPNGGLNWALTVHDLIVNGNVSAIDYMWAFFGEYSERSWPGNTLIMLKSDVNGLRYKGYERNAMYHAMAQYSRYVKPGFMRVGTGSSDPAVKVSAFKKNEELVVVAINSAPVPKRISLALLGGKIPSLLEVWRLTGDERSDQERAPLKLHHPFEVTLPARSVTTFESRQ